MYIKLEFSNIRTKNSMIYIVLISILYCKFIALMLDYIYNYVSNGNLEFFYEHIVEYGPKSSNQDPSFREQKPLNSK